MSTNKPPHILYHSDGDYVPLSDYKQLEIKNASLNDQLQWSLKNETQYKNALLDKISELDNEKHTFGAVETEFDLVLDERDEARNELAACKADNIRLNHIIDASVDKVIEQRKKIEKLEAALEYITRHIDPVNAITELQECVRVAQQALEYNK